MTCRRLMMPFCVIACAAVLAASLKAQFEVPAELRREELGDSAYGVSAAPDFKFEGVYASVTCLACVSGASSEWTDADIARLAALPCLRSLQIQSAPVSERGLETLASFKRLSVLDLGGAKLTKSGLLALAQSETLEQLRISLAQNSNADAQEVLASIGAFKRLKSLIIRDFSARLLAHAKFPTSLTSLIINDHVEVASGDLLPLNQWPHLRELQLPLNVSASDWEALALLPNLERISFATGLLDDVAAEGIVRLKRLQSVVARYVSDSLVAALSRLEDLRELAILGEEPPPMRLEKRRPNLTNLSSIAKCRKLRKLTIRFNSVVTDELIKLIADHCKLESLDLRGCEKVTDAGLIEVARFSTLEVLMLPTAHEQAKHDRMDIGDRGIMSFAKLTKLRYISLARNSRVTSKSLSALATLPALREIDISYCPSLTADSLALLASCKALMRLDLAANAWVSDDGLKSLGDCGLLFDLDLSGCSGVTNASFAIFQEIRSLLRLGISGTATTLKGVAEFQRLRNDVVVY